MSAGEGVFGPYRLLRRLAAGGMAEIFLAVIDRDAGFEKRVVVKRILPQFSADPGFVQMFIDEAVVVGRLSHPNIAQIHDFGQVDGVYFMAMEYIDGADMRRVMYASDQKQRPLTFAEVAAIGEGVARGLAYAHTFADERLGPLHIVHRDISPHNIMVSRAGDVKTMDFGIAKAAARATHTVAGMIKGKVGYMAPEQANGGELDGRCDQFALGVVLWEALSGKRLFEGTSDLDVLRRVMNCNVRDLRDVRPDVPPALDQVIMRCLKAQPDERYATMTDVEQALAGFRYSLGIEGAVQLGALVNTLVPVPEKVAKHTLTLVEDGRRATPGASTPILPPATPTSTPSSGLTFSPPAAVTGTPATVLNTLPLMAPVEGGGSADGRTGPTVVLPPSASSSSWSSLSPSALAARLESAPVAADASRSQSFEPTGVTVIDPGMPTSTTAATPPPRVLQLRRGRVARRALATLGVAAVATALWVTHDRWQSVWPHAAEHAMAAGSGPASPASGSASLAPRASGGDAALTSSPDEPSAEGTVPVIATPMTRAPATPAASAPAATPPTTTPPAASVAPPPALGAQANDEPDQGGVVTGWVSVRAVGTWLDVYLGGKRLGTTPVRHYRVPAGPLHLRLVNPGASIDRTLDLMVPPHGEVSRTLILHP